MRLSILQEHPAGILNILLDLHQELDRLSTIEKTMIVGESKIHHGSNDDLAVDNNWLILDSVKSKDSSLGKVDDWSAHQRTEDSSVAYGEGTTGHILNGKLVVASLGSGVSMLSACLDLFAVPSFRELQFPSRFQQDPLTRCCEPRE
jgi:hypothetical protein